MNMPLSVRTIAYAWQWISLRGIGGSLPESQQRRVIIVNRISVVAALAIFPFIFPAINPTSDGPGWVELGCFGGFLLVPVVNHGHNIRLGKFLLLLTINAKVFFSGSLRGFYGGEQLYLIPLAMGLLLLYDLRRERDFWWGMALTVTNLGLLEWTGYQWLQGVPLTAAQSQEIFYVNFWVTLVCTFLLGYYYFLLAERQFQQLEAGSVRLLRLNEKLQAREGSLSEHVAQLQAANQALRQQEADLREAQLQAERSASAKSAFLSLMSHELRTPMNAVMGMSAILAETPLDSDQRDYVETVRHSSQILLGMINNVLEYSQLDRGQENWQPKPLHLLPFIEQVTQPFVRRAQAKGLTLTLERAPELPAALEADPVHLAEMLRQLLDNALKFSPAGTISLRVTATPGSGEEPWAWCFTVADEGLGFDPARRQVLEEPFALQPDDTHRSQMGLGLGLAICQQLAHLGGGFLEIDSQPGQGTRASLHLPLPVPDSSPDVMDDAFNLLPKDLRLLVVEDNRINLKVVLRMLKRIGYEADIAENGQLGVEAVARRAYDLILMDIQMPVMDGFTATREILRQYGDREDRPRIVALTANTSPEDRRKAEEAGMDDFLGKPVTTEELHETLRRWCARL